jgi:hypothetical protein
VDAHGGYALLLPDGPEPDGAVGAPGQELRPVTVDEERSDVVRMAFEREKLNTRLSS